jgi:hypothetical protein
MFLSLMIDRRESIQGEMQGNGDEWDMYLFLYFILVMEEERRDDIFLVFAWTQIYIYIH